MSKWVVTFVVCLCILKVSHSIVESIESETEFFELKIQKTQLSIELLENQIKILSFTCET